MPLLPMHSTPLDEYLPHCCRYAGIGSRQTPPEILELMHRLGRVLAQRRLTLRSGAAPGADAAFEAGCDSVQGHKEIFLPWRGFNDHPSPLYTLHPEAESIAAACHPNWKACTPAARLLHARNVQQVLGRDLKEPVDFILFWAPEAGGRVQGGTATATRLALEMEIPTCNLRIEPIARVFRDFVEQAEAGQ